ncbi:hypothetical protein FA15DRAFT_634985 [Coprinopsis marcescibilis]|uniref:Isomerase YbhE n=1 Tax=Coprinopsis marcescibilis TaxID=230819 RepID=A0A5C3L4K5_COPMA|nr:hypothetical protein FA15DRAFT_634985 [Coprinopsis marcescibilis]
MVNFTILAGGFSNFIATYVFDSDAGSLALTKQNPSGDAPSWIASSLVNPSILYAVNEISPVGNLQSFIVDAEGGLTLVDTVSTGGNAPTFTQPLTTGEVPAANFGSPNASFISVDPADPSRFVKDNLQSTIVEFPASPSNPHQTLEHNGEVFIPDLGADKIWRVGKDEAGQFRLQGQIDIAPGNGPRHIAIRENLLFTLHEKTSVLTVQPIPEGPNGTTLPVIANVSIVPTLAPGFNGSFFAAEIIISEPTEQFPTPLIYVSNRNLGPEFDPQGDTIAIFEFTGFSGSNSTAGSPAPSGSTELGAGPVVTQLVAAQPEPSVVRRMIKRHARRRIHDEARRQYYGGSAGSAAPAVPSSSCSGSTVTLVAGSTPTGGASSPEQTPTGEGSVDPSQGTLVLVNQVPTGIRLIRSFAIGRVQDGGDEFVIAGGQNDSNEGGVAVFRRIEGGRNLELVARNLEIASRTSFVFLPVAN